MHDQADHLRHLALQRWLQQSLPAALVVVAGHQSHRVSLRLARALAEIQRSVLHYDASNCDSSSYAASSYDAANRDAANRDATAPGAPDLENSNRLAQPTNIETESALAMRFREQLEQLAQRFQASREPIELVVVHAGESSAQILPHWRSLAQQLVLVADGTRGSLLAQYAYLKDQAAQPIAKHHSRIGQPHEPSIRLAVLTDLQPDSSDSNTINSEANLKQFSETCQKFLDLELAPGVTLATNSQTTDEALATTIAADCLAVSQRIAFPTQSPHSNPQTTLRSKDETTNQEKKQNRLNPTVLH